VPTDQLPAVTVPRVPPKSGAAVDATQPLDEASLQRIVSREEEVPVDATQPMDAAMLAAIMSASPAQAEPASAPQVRPGSPGVAAPASPARVPKRASKAPLLLAVLAVAGLVTGSAVAYLILRGKQQPPAPVAAPAAPPPVATKPTAPDAQAVAPVAPAVPADGQACPAGMRHIPGGAFPMGTSPDERTKGFDERPLTTEDVASFCMDEFEFPNVPDSSPRVDVSWTEAKAACARVGKRLCSEGEWEKACKGPGHTRFPYGNTFDPNACNTEDSFGDDRALAHSGQFAKCRSGYGVADLSGNVAEWTASAYTNNADMTQKGGAFDRPDYAARCSARKNGAPSDRAPTVGFRCCADVRP
jgi:formylglycine-generating enzyme required for sulfatase activity